MDGPTAGPVPPGARMPGVATLETAGPARPRTGGGRIRVALLLCAPLALAGLLVAGLLAAGLAPAAAAPPLAGRIAAAQQQVRALALRVDAAVEEYDSAAIALRAARQRATVARGRVLAAQLDYRRSQDGVDAVAASAYRTGGADILALMVSGDATGYLDRAATYDQLSRSRAGALRDAATAAARLADQQHAAREAVAAAGRVQARMAATRAAIERDLAAQQQLLVGLRREQARLEAIARAKAAAARRAAAAARAAAARARAAALARQRAADRAAAVAAARARDLAAGNAAAQDPQSGAGPSSSAGTGSYTGPGSGGASTAVRVALAQRGKPYVWGAAGPGSFDCSGLTMYAWAAAGVSLTHSARAQYFSGPHVSQANLRPGDLVFFATDTSDPATIHHVGMYLGGGQMVAAPHTGDVVKVESYQIGGYIGAVRL